MAWSANWVIQNAPNAFERGRNDERKERLQPADGPHLHDECHMPELEGNHHGEEDEGEEGFLEPELVLRESESRRSAHQDREDGGADGDEDGVLVERRMLMVFSVARFSLR